MESVWFGVVEDVNDPLQLSRARVRVFNLHNPSLAEAPTSSLPWATVMSPTTSASVSGVGSTPHNLVPGSHVVGVFLDGRYCQVPMIIGSIAGMPMLAPTAGVGFNDPNKLYPSKDYIGRSDVNKLATIGDPHPIKAKLAARKTTTTTATGKTWVEPVTTAKSVYPHNHVAQSTSGHVTEVDDTPGNERLTQYHKSLTSDEILPDGSRVKHTTGTDYAIMDKDGKVRVKGNLDVTVDKQATIKLDGGVEILITGSGAHVKVVGPVIMDVTGNVMWNVKGNVTYLVSGAFSVLAGASISVTAPTVDWKVNGSMNMNITGGYSLNAGGAVNMNAGSYNFT